MGKQPDRMVSYSVLVSRARGWIFLLTLLLAGPSARSQSIGIDPSVSIPEEPQFTLQVMAECLGHRVMGLEVVVEFDPGLVRLDSITPGPWFTGGTGEFFFRDHTRGGTGHIHFSGALAGRTSDADAPLARCHFSALGTGESSLEFQEVDLRDGDNLSLESGHSTGDRIILGSTITTRERNFGAIKAIYR
jgi:hypothetical protein